MKLVVERSKWLRGEGHNSSYLLRRSDGKMCCLGFLGLVAGANAEEITNRCVPSSVPQLAWPSGLLKQGADGSHAYDEQLSCDLMSTNDNEELTEEAREKRLTELFTAIGVEVEFVD